MKLFIDNDNVQVPVAELGLINQKEQAIFGNNERDLILRTKGNIKVQVGSTFYDLNFDTQSSDGSATIGGVVVVANESDLFALTYPGDGVLIYVTSTKTFYISQDGSYISTNRVDENNKIYLSYKEIQSLTGDEKKIVAFNSGTILNSIDEVSTFSTASVYPGMVLFAVEQGRHYTLIDSNNPSLLISWRELYLPYTGGTLTGGLIIDAAEGFQIVQAFEKDRLLFNEPAFSGIYLGADYSRGLAMWQNSTGVYISSQGTTNSAIRFLSGDNTPLIIDGNSVGVGTIDYNYRFTVEGNSYITGKAYLGRGTASRDFISGQDGMGYDLSKDGDGKWVLELDKLIVRGDATITDDEYSTSPVNGSLILNSSIRFKSVYKLDSAPVYTLKTAAGKYTTGGLVMPLTDKSRRVGVMLNTPEDFGQPGIPKTLTLINLAFGIGDRQPDNSFVTYITQNKDLDGNLANIVGTHDYDGTDFVEAVDGDYVLTDTINIYSITSDVTASISVGDLFYYKQWKADKSTLRVVYAEVVNIDGDNVDFFVYGNEQITVDDTLIKIGNVNDPECMIDLNSFDKNNPYINVLSEIESFNDFVENIYYEDANTLDEGEPSATVFKQEQIRVRQGFLTDIIDTDLALTGTPEVGIYSDSAYIKGNIVANRAIFGTQLTYINGVLLIVDLETIKSRNITGINGLTGGGNLFAGNIQISHGASNWIDKEDLFGGTVISNIIVDSYGHPIDWTTRVLTTTEIAEGTNLYYTDARADNRINIQKGVPNGIAPLNADAKIDSVYLSDAILGGVIYKGTYDPTTNTPPLPAVTNMGWYYIINTEGTAEGINFKVGDWIISNGVEWSKVDNSDAVTTVFGRNGNVLANAGDYTTALVTEDSSYLYYTNARVQTFGDTRYSQLGHTHPWSSITSKPTTIAGYGITDAYTKTEVDGLILGVDIGNYYTKAASDARFAPIVHTHTFASLTSKPTTISGYGITDAYTKTEQDGRYSQLGHTHVWTNITDRPTALSFFTNDLGNYGGFLTSVDLVGYVPYTGATSDVDLGAHSLTSLGLKVINGSNSKLTLENTTATNSWEINSYLDGTLFIGSTTVYNAITVNNTTGLVNVFNIRAAANDGNSISVVRNADIASGQTIGANTTGNAGSATNWGGTSADFTLGDSPNAMTHLVGFDATGVVQPFSSASGKAFLNLNDGSALNNIAANSTLWRDYAHGFDAGNQGTLPDGIIGIRNSDNAVLRYNTIAVQNFLGLNDGSVLNNSAYWTEYDPTVNNANQALGLGYNSVANKWTYYSAANYKTFLATSLQDVTSVGNTITRTSGQPSILGFNDLILDADAGSGVYLNQYHNGNVILAGGGGKVGINNTTPTEALDVNGNVKAAGIINARNNSDKQITWQSNTSKLWSTETDANGTYTYNNTDGVVGVYQKNSGYIGINNTNPSEALDVTGNGLFSGGVQTAELTIKNAGAANINFIDAGLSPQGAIFNAYNYTFKVNGLTALTIDNLASNAVFASKITWGAGSYNAGDSQIWNDATSGTILVPKTGSSTDFLLTNGIGGTVLEIPTGTINANFNGTVRSNSGGILSTGTNAAYNYTDRTSSLNWAIYADGGYTRINNATNGDIATFDVAGMATFKGITIVSASKPSGSSPSLATTFGVNIRVLNGGDNTATSGFALGGRGEEVRIRGGNGGNSLTSSGTKIAGNGGSVELVAGDSGSTTGQAGVPGVATLQAGSITNGTFGTGGYAVVKGGTNTVAGGWGGSVYIYPGYGNNSTGSTPDFTYDGNTFLGFFGGNLRGAVIIGSGVTDETNIFQVTGTSRFYGTIAADNIDVADDAMAFRGASYPSAGVKFNATTGNFDFMSVTNTITASISAIASGGMKVMGGDIEVMNDATKGLILHSPDGTAWRVTVDNAGTLIVATV